MPSSMYTGKELKKLARKRGKKGMIGESHARDWLKAIRIKYGYKRNKDVPDTVKFYSKGVTKGKNRSKALRKHKSLPDIVKYSTKRDDKKKSGVLKNKNVVKTVTGKTIIEAVRSNRQLADGISAVNAFKDIEDRYGLVEEKVEYAYVWIPRWRHHIWKKASDLRGTGLKNPGRRAKRGQKGARGRHDRSHLSDTRRMGRGRTGPRSR